MSNGLVARGFTRMKEMVAQATGIGAESPERRLARIRQLLQECADGRGGAVSTRVRAANLAQGYLELDDEGRHAFLRVIALEFGPKPEAVARAHASYQEAVGGPEQWDCEAQLRTAMRSSRIRILTQFNAIPQGVKFLVDLRTDLLRFLHTDPELKALDRELEARLTAWFDVGFLELVRLTWHSPADVLEKIVAYEAVHQIQSWHDLKNRLDSDRRCYAFFHPRMPTEPLIFVEVALLEALADNVQTLLDIHAPLFDAQQASTAIFYSISSTQTGLRGVSFGNFLLKRVIDDLKRDFPRLRTFATLSPIPGLNRWAAKHVDEIIAQFAPADWKRLAATGVSDAHDPMLKQTLAEGVGLSDNAPLAEALRPPLLRAAATYLLTARRDEQPLDPVARFHLGNGARVERLNWLADNSEKGLRESWGIMVNYLYDPDRIEDNVEAFERDCSIDATSAIRRSLMKIP